jgi:hypothetical protein
MSVMSAAEARQGGGASPDFPPRRRRIATSAAGQDDNDAAGPPLDEGVLPPAVEDVRAGAGERHVSALRVTQVRMVRQVSVRRMRASGIGPVTAAQVRVPPQARVDMEAQVGAAAEARVATEAQVAGQVRVTGSARVAGYARVASQRRMTSQAGVAGRQAPQHRPGAVRLTRRGRMVVAGFAILVVIAAATLLSMAAAGSVQASSHASAPGSAYRGMTQVVVQPGQTLWSIATAADPSANTWGVVQQIVSVNALSSANVQSGELLWVPKG